jgi:hypothetical protein
MTRWCLPPRQHLRVRVPNCRSSTGGARITVSTALEISMPNTLSSLVAIPSPANLSNPPASPTSRAPRTHPFTMSQKALTKGHPQSLSKRSSPALRARDGTRRASELPCWTATHTRPPSSAKWPPCYASPHLPRRGLLEGRRLPGSTPRRRPHQRRHQHRQLDRPRLPCTPRATSADAKPSGRRPRCFTRPRPQAVPRHPRPRQRQSQRRRHDPSSAP